MTGKRLLFVGENIKPYLPDSPISAYGWEIPKYTAEQGMLVRALLPKYGCINERRNQLHEVIRLSGFNIIIDDNDYPMLIKVASLPGTKLQTYFIDNINLFKHHQVFTDENGVEYSDNYARAIFYARSTMETSKMMHWNPYIIHCQGWFSALIPFYLKNVYADDPIFATSKSVLTLYSDEIKQALPERICHMIAFRNIDADFVKNQGIAMKSHADYIKFCLSFADGIVCGDKDVPQEYIEFAKAKNIPVLEYSDEDFANKNFEFYKSI